MHYLAPDRPPAEAAEAEIFSAYREQVRATDPEAIAEDGTIIGRNGATGELEPDATRTTGYYGEPLPAVQGFYVPVPEEEPLQLADPAATGVMVTEHLNPWPVITPAGAPPPLPEWQQPQGAHDAYPLDMWVTHDGYDYCSLIAANVYEPTPESTLWRISPDPGALPWVQPTGSSDAYDTGDRVTHTYPGRTETLWESNIPANVYEPGGDGVYDRWWAPITDAGGEIKEWVQPLPGTAAAPYEVEAVVLFEGEEYKNTVQLNVWPTSGPGAYGWVLSEPVRARDVLGRFSADDPSTAGINEAWK
jgi:hypothetical protein